MLLRLGFFILALLGTSQISVAHPVIFKGGIELQGETQKKDSAFSTTYTFSPYWAVAAQYYEMREPSMSPLGRTFEASTVQINHLLKRWWNEGSQGNIYLGAGAGVFAPQGLPSEFLARGEVNADWESTTLYVAARYIYLHPDFSEDVDFKKLRVGFAPYVLEQEGLNSWFILEWRQMNTEKAEVTPLLRFFFRSVLFELGSSLDGDFKFNFMIHY